MANKTSEYWEKRIANNTWRTYNSIEDKNRQLIEFYQDASSKIRKELYDLAEKYSRDGVLSRSEMYKYQRLNTLEKSMQGVVKDLGVNLEKFAKKNMLDGFKDVFKNVNESIGNIDFAMPNKKLMEELLKREWRGSSFSKRVWKNQTKLADTLNSKLKQGLQQGKTATEMAVDIHNAIGQGFNEAHRLVRTETMHYLNSAALEGYKEGGCTKVRVFAAEDERTCEHCMQYHDKVFDIDKAPVLPLHPHCRCTYLPEIGKGNEMSGADNRERKKEVITNESERGMDYMSSSFRPHYAESSAIGFKNSSILVKKVSNSQFEMFTDVKSTRRDKAVRLTEQNLKIIQDKLPQNFEIPKIAVINFDTHNINANAIGGYDSSTGTLYLNTRFDTKEKILKFVNQNNGMFANKTVFAPYLHELGHKYYYDSIKTIAKAKKIGYSEAKKLVDLKIDNLIIKKAKENAKTIKYEISIYAHEGYTKGKYTEIVAECFTVMDSNEFGGEMISMIGGI